MVHAHPAAWELRPATRAAMLSRQIDVPGRWTDKGLGWNLERTLRGPVEDTRPKTTCARFPSYIEQPQRMGERS